MPRFRKTSRLTKKGGSDNSSDENQAVQALLDLQRSSSPSPSSPSPSSPSPSSPRKDETINAGETGSMTPQSNKINSTTGVATLGNIFNNVRSPVQTNLNPKLNESSNNHGGYKKSRKNSRIKSKRKKGGKSAKKRRRRTRGKKR